MAKRITGKVTFDFDAEVSDADAASIDAEGYISGYNWDRWGFKLKLSDDSGEFYAELDNWGASEYTIEEVEDVPDDDEEDLEEDLIDRAMRAYATRAQREGFVYQEPSSYYTHTPSVLDTLTGDTWDGDRHTYAVLENVNGVLAVYRLKDDGHIEYVVPDSWPGWLTKADADGEPECFEGSLNNDAGSPAPPFPPFLHSQLDRRADALREKYSR